MGRTALLAILIHFLATCPLWCATFEPGSGSPCTHRLHSDGGDHDASTPSPVNDDCCICNGAVPFGQIESADAAATHPELSPLPFEWLALTPWFQPGTRAAAGLTGPGGRSAPGDHCAPSLPLLQAFRC